MSYEVFFTMTTNKGEEETEKALSGISDLESVWEVDITPGEFANGRTSADMVNDMKTHSLLFPGVLFTSECEDNNGEKWIDNYRDGKHQCRTSRIVYEDFDESKLK